MRISDWSSDVCSSDLRSLYRPGDMAMFHEMTPHSGLPNTSDRFRMSMDVRVAPMTGELPIIGEVRRFADDAIDIGLPSGEAVTLSIDEDTYCRWTAGKRLSTRDLQKLLKVGDRVLASD